VNVDDIIRTLGLVPHTEGGYFHEVYRSAETVGRGTLPERYEGDRHYGSSIFYLLTGDTFSAMHRLKTDEVFLFQLGDPVELLRLYPDGNGDVVTLGAAIDKGHMLQCVVPRGCWMGLSLASGGVYGLLGTVMAPGFDFRDFEMGDREELNAEYPGFTERICRLTHR
jgi:predicted cupin superfamily sugar epimerase